MPHLKHNEAKDFLFFISSAPLDIKGEIHRDAQYLHFKTGPMGAELTQRIGECHLLKHIAVMKVPFVNFQCCSNLIVAI